MPTAVESVFEQICQMTALELSQLSKRLSDEFNVTAAAPMPGFNPAMMAAMVGGAAPAAPVEEEQTEFDVILTEAGGQKLQVIKVVRELTGLGLKEAKDLVDSAPKPVKQATNKDDAEKIKKALEDVGGKVEIK